MSIQFMDNFQFYGTSTSNMLDGLPWSNIAGSLVTDPDPNSDPDGDPNAHKHADANADTDTNPDRIANGDPYPDPNADGGSGRIRDPNTDTHGDANAVLRLLATQSEIANRSTFEVDRFNLDTNVRAVQAITAAWARNFSASRAAMQPNPAEVIACLNTRSWASPAANTPGTLVCRWSSTLR